MSQPTPIRIPAALQQDPEVRQFFDQLLRSQYQLWALINQNVGFYGTTPVGQADALTASLTTITHTEPGTADYAIQDLTSTTPFGFVTKNEGNTVLKVIKNLQTQVDELKAALDSSTGVGLIT